MNEYQNMNTKIIHLYQKFWLCLKRKIECPQSQGSLKAYFLSMDQNFYGT